MEKDAKLSDSTADMEKLDVKGNGNRSKMLTF
jgi:hypothetical protein